MIYGCLASAAKYATHTTYRVWQVSTSEREEREKERKADGLKACVVLRCRRQPTVATRWQMSSASHLKMAQQKVHTHIHI